MSTISTSSFCVELREESIREKYRFSSLIRKLTLIVVAMKFLLEHVYIKELRPSSSLKPEVCVQECEVQKNGF